jgi:hypothetical protein
MTCERTSMQTIATTGYALTKQRNCGAARAGNARADTFRIAESNTARARLRRQHDVAATTHCTQWQ